MEWSLVLHFNMFLCQQYNMGQFLAHWFMAIVVETLPTFTHPALILPGILQRFQVLEDSVCWKATLQQSSQEECKE